MKNRINLLLNLSVAFTVVCISLLFAPASPVRAAVVPAGFIETQIVNGLNGPTAMAIAPGGRIFVTEQGGAIRIIDGGVLLPAPLITLPNVDPTGERGLLGLVFDPQFNANGYLYVYYTVNTPPVHNRVSRFTVVGNTAALASETVILELDNLTAATNHNGGAMHFGPDGMLYIAVGENATPANSQDLGNLLGKILRINRNGGIPADNPFYNQAVGVNRAIWALGLRNPFTFAFQRGSGRMFINDVGQTAWEEINNGVRGGNYGWPNSEGPVINTPGHRAPLYVYPNGADGCAITGGIFYNPVANQFPAGYAGDYFFADYCSGWIRRYDIATRTVQNFATGANAPIDFDLGTDGSLYYLARGFGANQGAVYRIEYNPTQAPVINLHPEDLIVPLGEPASFTCGAVGNPVLQYQWQRDGVDIPGATTPTYTIPATVLGDDGAEFQCVVTNAYGTDTSDPALLTVINGTRPVAIINNPLDASPYSGAEVINYDGTGTDVEDGVLPAAALTWEIVFHHAVHTHPFLPPVIGAAGGTFTIPQLGHTESNVWYRLNLTVTDSTGLTGTTYHDILPRTASITLASVPPGLQLTLDGQPRTTPFVFRGVAGIIQQIGAPASQDDANGGHWEYRRWSDAGGRVHPVTLPDVPTTYTAFFAGHPGTPPGDQVGVSGFDPVMNVGAEFASGGFGLPGGTLTWVITVTNQGTLPGHDITVTHTMNPELRLSGASTGFGSYRINGATVNFTIPSLAPGESVELLIFGNIPSTLAGGFIYGKFSLVGSDPDGNLVYREAEGQFAIVAALPRTGYSRRPLQLLLTAVMVGVLAFIGGLVMTQRRVPSA